MRTRATPRKFFLATVCVLAAVAILVGCDGNHHTYITMDTMSDIEGYAYFPCEDELGNYPVYYDTGNYDILVTLYDADDIYYEYPLREYLTATMGYYQFINVSPGWYLFLTAEAQVYDEALDITDYYWTETDDFCLFEGELYIQDLFLEYDSSEPGEPLSAKKPERVN